LIHVLSCNSLLDELVIICICSEVVNAIDGGAEDSHHGVSEIGIFFGSSDIWSDDLLKRREPLNKLYI